MDAARVLKSQNVIRRIAKQWLVLGLAGASCMLVAATAHYVFGVPFHEGHSTRLASPALIAITVSVIGGGFSLFALMGAALLRWWPRT